MCFSTIQPDQNFCWQASSLIAQSSSEGRNIRWSFTLAAMDIGHQRLTLRISNTSVMIQGGSRSRSLRILRIHCESVGSLVTSLRASRRQAKIGAPFSF